VLDKSKADWQQMKAGDATVDEELEAHRRSGGQYLDKARGGGVAAAGCEMVWAGVTERACSSWTAPHITHSLASTSSNAPADTKPRTTCPHPPAQHSGRARRWTS